MVYASQLRGLLIAALIGCGPVSLFAQTRVTEEVEQQLRADLATAVARNPKLQGTWVDVKNSETTLRFEVVVDRDVKLADQQLDSLAKVILGIVGPHQPKLTSTELRENLKKGVIDRLPVRQLLEDLRRELEITSDLDAVSIDGSYLATDGSDEVFVFLIGRVVMESQRERLSEIANQKIAKLFTGSKRNIQLCKTVGGRLGISVYTPSQKTADYCYDQGVQKFVTKDYAAAYRAFTEAHRNALRRVDIQYWRVVCLLGSDNEADARQLLENLVEFRKGKSRFTSDAEILKSLEQVQGPLRMQLTEMEDGILYKYKK